MELKDGKEYVFGIEQKDGNKPRIYVVPYKDKDEVYFEVDDFGLFTRREFNSMCKAIGSAKVKVPLSDKEKLAKLPALKTKITDEQLKNGIY